MENTEESIIYLGGNILDIYKLVYYSEALWEKFQVHLLTLYLDVFILKININ